MGKKKGRENPLLEGMEFVNTYERLKAAYVNEVNCPELLPYEGVVISAIGG